MTYLEAIRFGQFWRERFPRASQERLRNAAFAFAQAWANHPRSASHLATAFLAGAER